MNNKMNVDFHTMDEIPFVDAPVYGRKLHGDIKTNVIRYLCSGDIKTTLWLRERLCFLE